MVAGMSKDFGEESVTAVGGVFVLAGGALGF